MSTTTKEVITVEKVFHTSKYPKFNSGSVVVDGSFINLKKSVDPHSFEQGGTYEVSIETNDKGYRTIVENLGAGEASEVKPSSPAPKAKRSSGASHSKGDFRSPDQIMRTSSAGILLGNTEVIKTLVMEEGDLDKAIDKALELAKKVDTYING